MDTTPIVPDTRSGQGLLSTALALHDLLTHHGLPLPALPVTTLMTSAEVLSLAMGLHTVATRVTLPGVHLARLKLEGLAAQCAFELQGQPHLAA